jgi:hypothetical protein
MQKVTKCSFFLAFLETLYDAGLCQSSTAGESFLKFHCGYLIPFSVVYEEVWDSEEKGCELLGS